ncbi:MAG TPA: C1 family peptidase [Candidatus Limnocylindrales bacterium]|nr:C1 family peptidase [Candidatus Limnocylindrales bacterium]
MTPNEDDVVLASAGPAFGTGGLYQEDPRDWPIDQLYAAQGLAAAVAFPSSWKAGTMPPVLNQGTTPECVAFSGSAMKARQDRIDEGQFFNFDEARFFKEIGGGPGGAYISSALSRLKAYGYPVVGVAAESHKIAAYYAVPKTIDDLKSALMTFGPLWCIGQWWKEWFHPGAGGVLPKPVTKSSGHATLLYGWNATGLIFRNSWGATWGAAGDFVLPWAYVFDNSGSGHPGYLWAAYKTTDVVEWPAKTMACGANVRATAGSGGTFGAKLGTIAAGAGIRVSGSVTGATWSKASTCNPAVANRGTKWYRVRVIGGRAVGLIYPGHTSVYIYAGAVKGG